MVGADAFFSGEGSRCPSVPCQARSQGRSAHKRGGEAHAAAVVAMGLSALFAEAGPATPLGTASFFPMIRGSRPTRYVRSPATWTCRSASIPPTVGWLRAWILVGRVPRATRPTTRQCRAVGVGPVELGVVARGVGMGASVRRDACAEGGVAVAVCVGAVRGGRGSNAEERRRVRSGRCGGTSWTPWTRWAPQPLAPLLQVGCGGSRSSWGTKWSWRLSGCRGRESS